MYIAFIMEKKRFREILKQRGISGKDFADGLGLAYGSYKSSMSRGSCPKWVLAFLMGHDFSGVSFVGDVVLYRGEGIVLCSVDDEEFERDAAFVSPEVIELKDGFDWKGRLDEQKKNSDADALND